MNLDEYYILFHKNNLNLVAFKRVIECSEEILSLVNEEYERGYEDGFIDGVKKNSESRVSKFMEKHSEPVWVGLTDEVQWRPIETAPKDGTVIDLWDGKYMHRVTNVRWGHQRWQDGKPVGEKEWGLITHDGKPTHWMRLPEPPGEKK
jgi:hypothetical protein